MAVQISGSKAKLTPEKIDATEKALGVELPEPYRRFLLAHNGGRPEPADFRIAWRGQPFAPGWRVGMVGDFLEVDSGALDLLENRERFADRIPHGMLPVARDPGGNLVLLGLDGDRRGKVYFWVHELPAEYDERDVDNLGFVADDFDAFLAGLHDS